MMQDGRLVKSDRYMAFARCRPADERGIVLRLLLQLAGKNDQNAAVRFLKHRRRFESACDFVLRRGASQAC